MASYLGWKAPQKKASVAEYIKLVESAKKSAAKLTTN
jgi:hypothetical protein